MQAQEHDSSSEGPRAQGAGRHSPGSCTPPGKVEMGRAQDSEDTHDIGSPSAVHISDPHPWSIQASVVWEQR